jgi:peptidyl-prolyl cis-trans isomerase B (cyclophilin B)
MSSNRPNKPQPKSGAPAARPPARPPAGGARPATRPQASGVRVTPSRPQSGARPPATGPTRSTLPVMLVAGAVVVVALFGLIAALMSNNNATASATPTAGAALGSAAGGAASAAPGAGNPTAAPGAAGAPAGAPAGGPSVAVVETPKGTFKIKLFTDDPAVKGAVTNFQTKVSSGYFDGKIFHRVEDWVVQGGDPTGTGTGGGDMPGEYSAHSFVRGSVGMASTGSHSPTVNDSQWFVCKKDSQFLDNNYVNFGMVTDGMDVVDKLAIGDTMTKITMTQ